MNFSRLPVLASPSNFKTAWTNAPAKALTELANCDESKSKEVTTFFFVSSLLSSFRLRELYGCVQTIITEQSEVVDVSAQLMDATLEKISPDSELQQTKIGRFILRDEQSSFADPIDAIMEDTVTGKCCSFPCITVQELQFRAMMFLAYINRNDFESELKNANRQAEERALELFPPKSKDNKLKARAVTCDRTERVKSSFEQPPGGTPQKPGGNYGRVISKPMSEVKEALRRVYVVFSDFMFLLETSSKAHDAEYRGRMWFEYLKYNPGQRDILEDVFPKISSNKDTKLTFLLLGDYCLQPMLKDVEYNAIQMRLGDVLAQLTSLQKSEQQSSKNHAAQRLQTSNNNQAYNPSDAIAMVHDDMQAHWERFCLN